MYYPYLRAKQFELKALREFSVEHTQDSIVPIIEPVRQETNQLYLAMNELLNNHLKFALILNPHDGDYKHSTVKFDTWDQQENLMNNKKGWIPAFIYSKQDAHDIFSVIEKYELEQVMIIFRTCMDSEDEIAWNLVKHNAVRYVVNAFGTSISRILRRMLKDTGREIIRLDDCFKSKSRNADYALTPDELLTEEPFFYKEEGQLDGYSDFTTLPSEYIEGGMLPYALVIHLSYRKNKEQLYVHHFVSDNNESNSDIRGKFREAAKKVAPFYSDKEKTAAVEEIIDKANQPEGYPGLGYLKKLSIKNHLELILSL